MHNLVGFILQVASVALIAFAMRWLYAAKGAQLPTIANGTRIYGIKWEWRALGLASAVLSGALAVASCSFLPSASGWVALIICSAISLSGLWIANGLVTTSQSGITKRAFLRSQLFRWEEVTEIRLHSKQGGAIELRAGSRKLIIDYLRFVAVRDLLKQIEEHTQLQPTCQ